MPKNDETVKWGQLVEYTEEVKNYTKNQTNKVVTDTDKKIEDVKVSVTTFSNTINSIKVNHDHLHITHSYKPSWAADYTSSYDECAVFNKKLNSLMVIYQAKKDGKKYAVIDLFDTNGKLVTENAYHFEVSGEPNSATYDDNTDSIIICFTGAVVEKRRYNAATMQFIDNFTIDNRAHFLWDNENQMYITYTFDSENFKYRLYDKNINLLNDYVVPLDSDVSYWALNQVTVYNGIIWAALNGQIYAFDFKGNYLYKSIDGGMFELEGLTTDGINLYANGHFSHADDYFYVMKLTENRVNQNIGYTGDKAIPFNGDLNNLYASGIFRCKSTCENKPARQIDSDFYVLCIGSYPNIESLDRTDCWQIAYTLKPYALYLRTGVTKRWRNIALSDPKYNITELPAVADPETIEFTSHTNIRVDNGYCNICAEIKVKKEVTSASDYFIIGAGVLPIPMGYQNEVTAPNEYYFPMYQTGSSEVYKIAIEPNGMKIVEKTRTIPVGKYYINIMYPINR